VARKLLPVTARAVLRSSSDAQHRRVGSAVSTAGTGSASSTNRQVLLSVCY
jgi:hypothetical protein